jgi:hypothetical protein
MEIATWVPHPLSPAKPPLLPPHQPMCKFKPKWSLDVHIWRSGSTILGTWKDYYYTTLSIKCLESIILHEALKLTQEMSKMCPKPNRRFYKFMIDIAWKELICIWKTCLPRTVFKYDHNAFNLGVGRGDDRETPQDWDCVHGASKESSMLPWHKEDFSYYKRTAAIHLRVAEAVTLLRVK